MSEVSALEGQLSNERTLVDRRQMALRLATNPDFKKLILEEFCVHEAARYAHTSADPMMSPNERADALAIAQASGHLKRWLSVVVRMGDVSERNISAIQEAIDQTRAEEVEGAE